MASFFKEGNIYTVSPPIKGYTKLKHVFSDRDRDGVRHSFIPADLTVYHASDLSKYEIADIEDQHAIDIFDRDINYPRPYTMKYTMEVEKKPTPPLNKPTLEQKKASERRIVATKGGKRKTMRKRD